MKGIFSRAAVGVAVTALLAVSSIPVSASAAAAGPVLDVSNPSPNDYLRRGRHVISGVAFDPTAKSGAGVDQVNVFLGDRDAGGTFYVPGGYLGTATLGLPNNGWSLKMKSLRKGSYTLFVYARSSVTGRETVVQIPIRVDKP